MKTLLKKYAGPGIGILSGGLIASALFLLLSSSSNANRNPESPVMQTFSMTPRFPDRVEVFGQKVDLTRYDRHERYERELTGMCYTHNNTLLTIKRANRYAPIIAPILKEENIPADFLYLAAIESSFNPRAYSPAKAAGIWQFIPETGRRYGLEINAEVDERYNVEKATRAACRYLREAYEKYGDWFSVAASYNAGQARISKQLAEQDEDTALDLLLNEETSRYLFRIMAMKEIMRDPYRYGYVLYSDQLYKPLRTREVKINGSIADMTAFAKKNHCSYFQLKEFNPWLRDKRLTNKTGKTYTILLPEKEDLHYTGAAFPVYDRNWVVN